MSKEFDTSLFLWQFMIFSSFRGISGRELLAGIIFVATGFVFSGVSASAFSEGMRVGDDPFVFRSGNFDSSIGNEVLSSVPENESTFLNSETEEEARFRAHLEELLRGTPIAEMAAAISHRDRETAAYLVAIARKESSWGLRSPSKDGIDCFNYWGYKGFGGRGVGMGHACFASREEAVETVGNRIAVLIHEEKLNSPERLIVWKCGRSCEGHSPESVAKWIADVRLIYSKVLPKG